MHPNSPHYNSLCSLSLCFCCYFGKVFVFACVVKKICSNCVMFIIVQNVRNLSSALLNPCQKLNQADTQYQKDVPNKVPIECRPPDSITPGHWSASRMWGTTATFQNISCVFWIVDAWTIWIEFYFSCFEIILKNMILFSFKNTLHKLFHSV